MKDKLKIKSNSDWIVSFCNLLIKDNELTIGQLREFLKNEVDFENEKLHEKKSEEYFDKLNFFEIQPRLDEKDSIVNLEYINFNCIGTSLSFEELCKEMVEYEINIETFENRFQIIMIPNREKYYFSSISIEVKKLPNENVIPIDRFIENITFIFQGGTKKELFQTEKNSNEIKFPVKAFIINTILVLMAFLISKTENEDGNTILMVVFFYFLPIIILSLISHTVFYILNRTTKRKFNFIKYFTPSLVGLVLSLDFGFTFQLWLIVLISTVILIITDFFSNIK